MAHCFLYLILAILVFTQCRLYKVKPLWAFVVAVDCCLLYSLTDEFHQRFVEGRTSCIGDVCADSLGACIGAALTLVSEKLCRLFKGAEK
ncbi:MAG: VanZ family protein [Clostridiales bacterium]|nr:VanZ family protein [Clostridiales bacterium]